MSQTLLIEQDAVEPFFKNGYLLACRKTRQGIYIDPGDEASLLLPKVKKHNIQLTAIVNTHAHIDHISGVSLVKETWDVPIYLHPEDEPLYDNLSTQAQRFGLEYPPAPPLDHQLQEGEDLQVGNLTLKVYHTPGHSPGSVCLEVEDHVFCGDVIFAGNIGRTDLWGGSYEILMDSIQRTVIPLGEDRILHPGHGPETTMGQELKTNPFLRAES
jgi:glyoxylase-like metal-dependent hydrolase (beta-lactamase superfamily II)